jgi:hypothetical protein
MKILPSLAACALLSLIACGSPAPETEAAEPTASIASPLSSPLIYFGQLEVLAGKLKSADGTLPKAGGSATLRLFMPELAQFLCRDYCMALYPHLFVRTKGTESFIEVGGIPNGDYNMRGPQASWPRDTTDVVIYLPSDADRIEVYMNWGRISWNGVTCYLAYDMMECPDWFGIDGAYLSNYGRNFRIDVAP